MEELSLWLGLTKLTASKHHNGTERWCVWAICEQQQQHPVQAASPNAMEFSACSSWHDAASIPLVARFLLHSHSHSYTHTHPRTYVYKVIQCCSNKVLHKYLLDYRTYQTHAPGQKQLSSVRTERTECHCHNEYKAMNIAISAGMNKWVQYSMELTSEGLESCLSICLPLEIRWMNE